jgi:hypothetical protein
MPLFPLGSSGFFMLKFIFFKQTRHVIIYNVLKTNNFANQNQQYISSTKIFC